MSRGGGRGPHDAAKEATIAVAPRVGSLPRNSSRRPRKRFGKVVEAQCVARPVVAGQCVPDPLARDSSQSSMTKTVNQLWSRHGTSDSREVVIEATPEEILDVIADVEATPDVVAAVSEGRGPGGLPRRQAEAGQDEDQDRGHLPTSRSSSTPGPTTWSSWTLVVAGQLKAQDAQLHADARRRQDQGQVRHRRSTCRSRCPASCSSAR